MILKIKVKSIIAKFLWSIFKDYFYTESGKSLINRTPWFRVSIFGEKVALIDYTEIEMLNIPR